jgi:GNAT superfamily N-acetyltransferase
MNMHVDPFQHDDIEGFLALAAGEGWVCDRWEFDFLLEQFPRGCLTAREGGEAVGFVTSIKHDVSGWIGNLIVRPGFRERGIGSVLMGNALDVLTEAGAETVWLTASRQGKPIYERLGFSEVDVINRWVGKGLWNDVGNRNVGDFSAILETDRAGWGDRRESLIAAVLERGRLYIADDAFLVCQTSGGSVQIGPWGGTTASAQFLLEKALLEAGKGAKVVLDVPIRNTWLTSLLLGRGFAIGGSTLLMCRGKAPAYAPEFIGALASMGSMG